MSEKISDDLSEIDDGPVDFKDSSPIDNPSQSNPVIKKLSPKEQQQQFEHQKVAFTLLTAQQVLIYTGAALAAIFIFCMALRKETDSLIDKLVDLGEYIITVTLTYLFAKSDHGH